VDPDPDLQGSKKILQDPDPEQKSSKKLAIKIHQSRILFGKYICFKMPRKTFKIVGIVESGTFCYASRIRIQNSKENGIWI
jgi:hypothetical protein